MEEERRHAKRRGDDQCGESASCPAVTLEGEIKELRATVARLEAEATALHNEVLDELRTIRAQGATQLEIMTAWNNAKGFVRSVQTIGGVMTWLAKISAVIAALWAAIHYGGGR